MKPIIIISVIFVIIISACAPETATPVPTATVTAIPTATTGATITPTPVPQSLADAPDLPTWVEDYVHAYGSKVTVNGVAMDAKQLSDAIRRNPNGFVQKKTIKGEKYSFLVVNGIPLSKLEGGLWTEISLRDLFTYNNMISGEGISGMGEFDAYAYPNRGSATDEQKQFFFKQFGIFAVTPQIYLGDYAGLKDDLEYLKYISSLANDYKMTAYGPHIIGHAYAIDSPEWTTQFQEQIRSAASEDEKQQIAEDWIEVRVRKTLIDMPNISTINISNEVLRYDGTTVLPNQWPMLEAFQGDATLMIARGLEVSDQVAQEMGSDVTFVINDWGVELDGPKADAFLTLLQDVKTNLTNDGKEIPFGVGLQFHVVEKKDWYLFTADEYTEEKLVEQFKEYGAFGPVYITELNYVVDPTLGYETHLSNIVTDSDKIVDVYGKIIRAAIKSESVNGIIFWSPIPEDVFQDSNWEVNKTFFEIQKILFNELK